MTDIQKLIATEIVKQRMKRVSSETLLSRGDWPMFKASDLKRDIQQTHAIESVLSQLLHDVSKIIKEGGKS